MKNRCNLSWLIICTFYVFFIVFSRVAFADEKSLSPEQIMEKYRILYSERKYSDAAQALEEYFVSFPNKPDAQVYRLICEMYYNHLFDFPKAYKYMKEAINKFPKERFVKEYGRNIKYLVDNKDDWEVIREFRLILFEYDKYTTEERTAKMQALKERKSGSEIKSKIYYWLSEEEYKNLEYDKALKNMTEYFQISKTVLKKDNVEIFNLYADILTYTDNYEEAIRTVNQMKELNKKGDNSSNDYKMFRILRYQMHWRIWNACLVFLGLVVFVIIWLKFWKERPFKWGWKVITLSIMINTIITMSLFVISYKVYYEGWRMGFVGILIASVVAVLLTRMLLPLKKKFNASVYYIVSHIFDK